MSQTEKLLRWFHGFQAFVQSREEYHPIAHAIAAPPEAVQNPEALRIVHVRTAIHTLYSPEVENLLVGAVNAFGREVLGVTDPIDPVPPAASAHVEALRQQGYSFLPDIDPGKLGDMVTYLKEQPVYEKTSGAGRVPIPMPKAEAELNLAHFHDRDLLNCPHLLEIATDPLRLGIAQTFLGAVPQVITVAAWWSFAQAEQAKAAQLFHLDMDDYRFFKFFIYMTDVDEEAGPHVFVPTTNRQETLVAARQRAPSPEAFDNWMGTLRKSDEDVLAAFGIEPVHIMGKAGSNFIACTRGIHKGLLPKSKNRLICQVAYGITPQRVDEHLPVTLSPETVPNLPADFLTPPMDYVMQLYLKAPGGP